MTSLSRILARVSEDVSCSGNASTHLVKRSLITKMYLLPLTEGGRGPMMSHAIFWNGREVSIGIRGAMGIGGGTRGARGAMAPQIFGN